MSLTDWGLLTALSLLWGGSFFFGKVAVATLPPLAVVLVRVLLASLTLLVVLRFRGTRVPRGAGPWRQFLLMGLLNNVIPFSLIFWAETVLSSGLAAILIATTPVFSLVVARLLTADTRLSGGKLLGVTLGLAGVTVLVGTQALSGMSDAVVPTAACLGAALSYGFANVYGRRFRGGGVEPVVVAFGQVTASVATMLPLALVVDTPWRLPVPGPAVWAALVSLALLSTALAYSVFFRLLATAGAINSSLVTLLVPVSAVLLGSLFLEESLSLHQAAGMALIGLSLLAIDGRLWRHIHTNRRPTP